MNLGIIALIFDETIIDVFHAEFGKIKTNEIALVTSSICIS